MKKILLSLLIFIWLLAGQTSLGFAAGSGIVNEAQKTLQSAAQKTGINTAMTLEKQIALIVKLVLGFLGVVFLILTIIAGFKWMTAGGDANQVKDAQSSLSNSAIGLGIILFSYLITNYVVFALFEILAK
jgi:hypothetical protein